MTALDELTPVVPAPRREADLDGTAVPVVAVKAVAVAVARPDLDAAGVTALLQWAEVDVSEAEVAEHLAFADLAGTAERTEFVALLAPRRGRLGRAAQRLLTTITRSATVVAVVLLVALALLPRTGWYRTTTMLTGSMAPGIPVGAGLVAVPERVADVRVGQVVAVTAPLPGRPVVTHRVVQVVTDGGRTGLRTKGDANAAPDPWTAFPDGDRVWRVSAVVPGLGTLLRALQTGEVRTLLVLVLPALVAAVLLLGVWRRPCDGSSR